MMAVKIQSSDSSRVGIPLSCVLIGLTAAVVLFQTMESTEYLQAIRNITKPTTQFMTTEPFRILDNVGGNHTESLQTHTHIPTLSASFQNEHPLCQRLAFNSTSDQSSNTYNNNILNAGNIWMKHWDDLLEASFFPLNTLDDATKDIYRNLLFDLPPSRLEDGLLTYPRSNHIERIWTILEQRRIDPINSPPLRILVMGGSVTEGVGCVQIQKGVATVEGRNCNWSVRLESFVNHILGYNAIEVINIAQGGTGTNQALSIIKYWMYPDRLQGKAPDIIIHAFGSNDSNLGELPSTEQERISQLHENGVSRLNNFVQTLQKSHPCPTPILLHLDDYFGGHQQGAMIGDFTYRMVLKEVAGWYHNMAVSSAQVVDDLIYPDIFGETTFSPRWHIRTHGTKKGHVNVNVHFGYAGHLAILWTWVYNALKTAVHFCNEQDWEQHQKEKEKQHYGDERKRKSFVKENVKKFGNVNPPPLDYELQLHNVSDLWADEKKRQEQYCDLISDRPPCVMAWVAGPEGRTSDKASLDNYLSAFRKSMGGWKYDVDLSHGWSRKLGLAPSEPNAMLQFELSKIAQPTTILTIHSLKSYGEDWEGSEVEVMIKARDRTLANADTWKSIMNETISGLHNSTSTITYTTEIQFPQVHSGSDIQIDIKLVGGSKFKITGMMLCSR